MLVLPHVSVDDIVERFGDRRAPDGRLRILLAGCALIVALVEQSTPSDGAVLLWVPVVSGAVLAGWRLDGVILGSAALVVGHLSVPDDAPPGAVVSELVGRGAGLAAIGFGAWWVRGAARELAQRSRTDAGTGLLNHAGFLAVLQRERERSRRSDTPLSLVYLDLDGLKGVNDRFGHEAGNDVIRRFAFHLERTRRSIDVAARIGGDEFALLLPDTDAQGVERTLQRLFQSMASDPAGLRASAGAATWLLPPPVDDMLHTADDAMYVAKRAGGQQWMLVDIDRMVTTQGTATER